MDSDETAGGPLILTPKSPQASRLDSDVCSL